MDSSSDQNDQYSNGRDSSPECSEYAGISPESTRIYGEQINEESVSEEAYKILTENINYKLRHIIHDCLVKSKLQGREYISSENIEEAFSNFNIGKTYGAPSSPNWVPFRDMQDNTLFCLDDKKISLIETAEKEINYCQEGDIVLDQAYLSSDSDSENDPNEHKETLAEYFETMCQAVVSENEEIRHMALFDISTNPSIGPITDWFYHFSYFLLIKDVTYDILTMRALHLLEVLENSPLPSTHIYGKQLKLLVRLLLERLLTSSASEDIVKHMSYVLSLFCLRKPLKEMVLNKLEHNVIAICEDMAVPLLNIIYYIGIDSVKKLFLPHTAYFMRQLAREEDLEKAASMKEIILAIYGLICKANLNKGHTYRHFSSTFELVLVPYYRSKYISTAGFTKEEIDVVKKRAMLIKTRRKVDYRSRTVKTVTPPLEKIIFEITPHNCIAERSKAMDQTMEICDYQDSRTSFKIPAPCCNFREKLDSYKQFGKSTKSRKEAYIIVGKTSLILPILKKHKQIQCYDHSMLSYVI